MTAENAENGENAAPPPGSTWSGLGAWADFRERMLRGLPRQVIPPDAGVDGARPLSGLTTRAPDDPTVAVVDAFACVCDVLSFYQERIVEEGFLATATEDRSVREIVGGLGYQPAPGAAATADLAFTVDPAHRTEVVVPAGHAVLSVPAGQGELPVTFETAQVLRARAAWNALPARRTRPHATGSAVRTLHLAGLATGLVPGDLLALVVSGAQGAGGWALHPTARVTPDLAAGHTVVTLGAPLTATALQNGPLRVVAFARSGGLFGWNAPDPRLMPAGTPGITPAPPNAASAWDGFPLANDSTLGSGAPTRLDLDAEYPEIVPGGLVCLYGSSLQGLFGVSTATPAARVGFALSGRVTRIGFDTPTVPGDLVGFDRRGTRVLLGSRVLPTVDEPDPDPVRGSTVTLQDRTLPALPDGRAVLVVGTGTDGAAHVVRTRVTAYDADGPAVTLDAELPAMERGSVVIRANVAVASHGTTVPEEVLGNGDAAVVRQAFTLRHKPLTWVAGDAGVEPALTVRVDGVRWDRVESLYTAGPRDRVYLLRREHDGSTTVVFGDGRRGARVPTGVENVRASYRAGLGAAGRVDAGQLALLRDRPLGLQAVTNPARSSGAADPENPGDAVGGGARTGVATDRLVALADYQAFAEAFPGIGKALAADLHDGRQRFVHLTVAGAAGEVLQPKEPVITALWGAVRARRDPAHLVLVDGHDRQAFRVQLTLRTDPRLGRDAVEAAARAALADRFSFAARRFGQPVAESEVIAVAQRVPGVVAVELEQLTGPRGPARRGVLSAQMPRWDGQRVVPAELLTLDLGASQVVSEEAP
ncbi:putative baseplate assembly protein [Pseudonocardia sp.]|uniref:putative baseplate assembly protein n=1 Tax=Pseudonocardia sp. TaxID=60912 RepID=UPI003D10989A